MKKLLLFAFTLGLGTISYAQTPTNISINGFDSPTGTVYIDGSGSGNVVNILTVAVTNNDAGVDFNAGSVFSYAVTLDGNAVMDPDGLGWARNNSLNIPSGTSQSLILSQSFSTSVNPGNYELCVSLNNVVVPPAGIYVNVDPNKQFCKSFDFDFTAGVGDMDVSEISRITTNGNLLTVYVKNASQNVQINLMSMTGQIVKTVSPNSSGQNFYQNIEIGDLTSGVYIVTIQTENGISAAKKVFIQ